MMMVMMMMMVMITMMLNDNDIHYVQQGIKSEVSSE